MIKMKMKMKNTVPSITTVDTYLLSFQYKILNNILFLNKKLFVFWIKNTPLCSFCNKEEETLLYIFSECTSNDLPLATVKNSSLKQIGFNSTYTPQTALLWLFSNDTINGEPRYLLTFKVYVYNSKEKYRLN